MEVPQISMEGNDLNAFSFSLVEALRQFGFAILTHHGVRSMDELYGDMREFFNLSGGLKAKYSLTRDDGHSSGFMPFGSERAVGAVAPDNKSFWNQRKKGWPGSIHHEPIEVPTFVTRVNASFDQLQALFEHLVKCLEIGLKLKSGVMTEMIAGGNHLFRLIDYPVMTDGVKGVRAARHCDINLLTLLPPPLDDAGGLWLRTRQGAEIEVVNPPGSIIINAGLMLQMFSAGELIAGEHWVANGPNRRMRAVFFGHPHQNAVICTKYGQPYTEQQALQYVLSQINVY